MASVANDADDLIGLVPDSGPNDQSLAQCFLVREDAVDESLTDDDRLVALAHFLLEKVRRLFRRIVFLPGQVDAQSQNVVRIESGIDVLQCNQTPDEESGCDQQ